MSRRAVVTMWDKTSWGPGEWCDEPDAALWYDEDTELACLAMRDSALGGWWGYVGVTVGHPLFEADNADDRLRRIAVHGGVQRIGACCEHEVHLHDEDEGAPMCHQKEPGDVRWIGFSCETESDHCPLRNPLFEQVLRQSPDGLFTRAPYRTLDYVTEQCEVLAAQVAALVDEEVA